MAARVDARSGDVEVRAQRMLVRYRQELIELAPNFG
jgi:hypothetical protein